MDLDAIAFVMLEAGQQRPKGTHSDWSGLICQTCGQTTEQPNGNETDCFRGLQTLLLEGSTLLPVRPVTKRLPMVV